MFSGRDQHTDSVNACAILEQEQASAQQETTSNAAVREDELERLPEAETHCVGLVLDSIVDGGDFFLHVDMVFGEVAKPAEVLNGLLALPGLEEPSRGFFDEEGSNHEHTSRDKLDSKGDDPLAV
jgi:hypothetical protein